MPLLRDLLARRTDLSTFIVHLTRTFGTGAGAANLRSIIATRRLEARTPFGAAISTLRSRNSPPQDWASQRCVCFTETPLEHLHLLLSPIHDLTRQCEFEPYGIAFTKRMARDAGLNPVWYTDITPGHDWLMKPVNRLIDAALDHLDELRRAGDTTTTFGQYDVSKLAPFIEQMGSGPGYRKEFWWEREWRVCGSIALPLHFIVVAPEDEHEELAELMSRLPTAAFVDARWGLEEIIGRLAGFTQIQVAPPI